MKPYLCLVSGVCALMSAGCAAVSQASVEPPVPVVVAPPAPAEKGSLDELVAPIALYPDALVALILPAATTSSDVVLAARYLAGGGDREKVAEQPWEDSVKALAHYPDVVKWMDENLAWTQQLGAAYLDEPAEVMAAIQRDRARAKASGVLTDTPQQQVVVVEGNLRIIPAQPEVIYIPRYDPQIVYVERPVYYSPDPWLTFGVGFGVGSWLAYDCDWRARTIWIDHHRHQRWRDHRHDWRHPRFPNRPVHSAYHPGWQRWKPSPDRHIEHRRHRDRHDRFVGRQSPAVRTPDSNRARPDGRWQNRDRDRHSSRFSDRNRRPDHTPNLGVAPANRVPAVRPPAGVTHRPAPNFQGNRGQSDDRHRRWQHDNARNRPPGGNRDANIERRPARAPSHAGGRPAIGGASDRPAHRMNPAGRTPPRIHTPPARVPAASHGPAVSRPAAPVQAQRAPAPAVRHERPARTEARAERSGGRDHGRGHSGRRHEN